MRYVGTCYVFRVTSYMGTQYAVCDTQYVILSTPFVVTLVRWYELISTCHVGTCYAVRATWLSPYDFPPLVSFQGRFAFRKWFCFLDLKIKNGWQFHFRDSNFSGKGNKGEYSRGCYFLVYIYKVSMCGGCIVSYCGLIVWGLGWLWLG